MEGSGYIVANRCCSDIRLHYELHLALAFL